MRVVKKLLRPVYKHLFERPLWWFLAKVKAFFLAEISVQIAAIEERLRTMDANNATEWNAVEQLLLSLFRQPEVQAEADARSASPRDELTADQRGE
jgi:hypothetical protein